MFDSAFKKSNFVKECLLIRIIYLKKNRTIRRFSSFLKFEKIKKPNVKTLHFFPQNKSLQVVLVNICLRKAVDISIYIIFKLKILLWQKIKPRKKCLTTEPIESLNKFLILTVTALKAMK